MPLFALVAGAGCRKAPAYRLTYEVDTARADDGEKDTAKVMTATRDAIARRLHALRLPTTVTVHDSDLIVDVPAIEKDHLTVAKTVLAQAGHVAIELVDEEGSAAIFDSAQAGTSPADEDVELYREKAPDGLDESGNRKSVTAYYARSMCGLGKHASETLGECLARLRTWASHLGVPSDHRVGFEAINQMDPDDRIRTVGWRTLYLHARREIPGGSIVDASIGRDTEGSGGYYVSWKLDDAGAVRLEDVTGRNVNRRMAILIEDIVQEAPVIRTKIGGGRVQVTMGSGDLDKQLADAKQLQLILMTRPLPAPIRLKSEVDLRQK